MTAILSPTRSVRREAIDAIELDPGGGRVKETWRADAKSSSKAGGRKSGGVSASPRRLSDSKRRNRAPADLRDLHHVETRATRLEEAIGHEARAFRHKLTMTIRQLAQSANMSMGMISKVENAQTSPSLATLSELARALQVPITAFFRKFEEERSAIFVKAGRGLPIERRGTRAGRQYHLLAHSFSRLLSLEPYLITLSDDLDVFPLFEHEGVEFLFMLKGEVGYRYGDKIYPLRPGDSLYFDADVPHGPEELRKLPARYLSVIATRS
jgi:transcriptional regulator with XRE-family HTH domain